MTTPDARMHAPAAERNKMAIADVLMSVLPERGLVLEVASGTGQHAAYLAERFPQLDWQPSDPEPGAAASIAAWCAGKPNILPPVRLDATNSSWPIAQADALLCINMIHIAPWQATTGLLQGGARVLPVGAPAVLYGPFRRAGVPTAPSNEAFDASLKARDLRWGLRELEHVTAKAEMHGFVLEHVVEMPANNLTVIFRRSHDN